MPDPNWTIVMGDVLTSSIEGDKIKVTVGHHDFLDNDSSHVVDGMTEFLLTLEQYTMLVDQGCVGEND